MEKLYEKYVITLYLHSTLYIVKHDREKMSIAEYQLLVKKMPTIIRKKNLASVHMRLAELVNAQLWQQLYDDVLTQRGAQN